MADNLISYNRFTSLPNNIANYGQTVEEIQSQRGTPDANPMVSPMASPRVSDPHLALARAGSDKIRLNQPSEPVINPYEGPKSVLTLSRSATQKLKGAVVGQLQGIVGQGSIGDENLQRQMDHSLQRVKGLAEFLDYQNSLTDRIYAMTLSVSKG